MPCALLLRRTAGFRRRLGGGTRPVAACSTPRYRRPMPGRPFSALVPADGVTRGGFAGRRNADASTPRAELPGSCAGHPGMALPPTSTPSPPGESPCSMATSRCLAARRGRGAGLRRAAESWWRSAAGSRRRRRDRVAARPAGSRRAAARGGGAPAGESVWPRFLVPLQGSNVPGSVRPRLAEPPAAAYIPGSRRSSAIR